MPIVYQSIIFAVLSEPENVALAAKIAAMFPDDNLSIRPGEWLIASIGTAKEMSDKLGVTDGSNGSAIVLATSSYYGRASNQVWEWIASKMGAVRSA